MAFGTIYYVCPTPRSFSSWTSATGVSLALVLTVGSGCANHYDDSFHVPQETATSDAQEHNDGLAPDTDAAQNDSSGSDIDQALGSCLDIYPTAGKIPAQGDPQVWFCLPIDYKWPSFERDGGVAVQTPHYDLYFEDASPAEAEDLARLAEAAFEIWTRAFGSIPTGLDSAPLEVEWYADQAGFEEAIIRDGGPPKPDTGGFYYLQTRKVYLHRQGTRYYSRVLFLHELAHQFHYLARTENAPVDNWYAEGLAEFYASHEWDGDCLRMGQISLLSFEDYPFNARKEATESGLDLQSLLDSGNASRPVGWAVFYYLQHAQPPGWRAFRDAMDTGTGNAAKCFSELIGDPDTIGARIHDWLNDDSSQQPIEPLYSDCWALGDRDASLSLRCTGFVAASHLKHLPATLFEVTIDPELALDVGESDDGWLGGVITNLQSPTAWQAYLVSKVGRIFLFKLRFDEGLPPLLAGFDEVQEPPPWKIRIDYARAVIDIGGSVYELPDDAPLAAGVVVYSGDVAFLQVGWE